MRIERTKNTFRNTIWGFINKLIMLVFPFVIRTVIIYILGINYTGLSSLFNSILSVLSLAELGVSSAIVYSMYAPIAENDESKICALMKLYRRVYFFIGLFVLVVGLIILPFIPAIIKSNTPNNINVYLLYGIYLINSVSSYWLFAYKNCLLDAFQRVDISVKVSTIVNLIMYGLEIAALLITKNYYYYAICLPITSIMVNVITAKCVDRMFPQYIPNGTVSKEELKSIFLQVIGLMAQKLAFISRNAFDSIIISAYLGLVVVGIYNNYFMVLNSVTALLAILYTAMLAGIGNSMAKESVTKNYSDFRRFNFLYMWIAGWSTICIYVLVQPFMNVWVGNQFTFSEEIVFLLSVYFFAMKLTDMLGVYVSTSGTWWKCKKVYVMEAITNLALNVGLGYYFGVVGIVIATIISVIFVDFLGVGIVLYRSVFSEYRFKELIFDDLLFCVITLLAMFIQRIIYEVDSSFINNSYVLIIVNLALCMLIPNVIYLIIYSQTKLGRESITWMKKKFLDKGVT